MAQFGRCDISYKIETVQVKFDGFKWKISSHKKQSKIDQHEVYFI